MAVSRKLLEYLADNLEMEGPVKTQVLGEYLFIKSAEVIRLYRPRSNLRFGSRLLQGEIGLFLPEDAPDCPKLRALPASISACPIANFPDLILRSGVKDDQVEPGFIELLSRYLEAIPQTRHQIEDELGKDFLSREIVDRVVTLAHLLRSKVQAT